MLMSSWRGAEKIAEGALGTVRRVVLCAKEYLPFIQPSGRLVGSTVFVRMLEVRGHWEEFWLCRRKEYWKFFVKFGLVAPELYDMVRSWTRDCVTIQGLRQLPPVHQSLMLHTEDSVHSDIDTWKTTTFIYRQSSQRTSGVQRPEFIQCESHLKSELHWCF